MSPNRLFSWLFFAVVLISTFGAAESTDCGNPVLIVADGRQTNSTFAQGTSNWYGIYASAGHSYSVEFVPPADNFATTPKVIFVTIGAINVFAPSDLQAGCQGRSSVVVADTSAASPALFRSGIGMGHRVSFTASGGGLYLIKVVNYGGMGSYTFRAVDTTMFSQRWSTFGGYDNHWGFLNVSDVPISGVLTVFDNLGNLVAAAQIYLPVGNVRLKFSFPSDMNLPRNDAGFVMFSHNGPPGSVMADAYMANLNLNIVFPSRFETRSPQ